MASSPRRCGSRDLDKSQDGGGVRSGLTDLEFAGG